MKKMKKLLSMLLAVVMVLAMAAPSFADSVSEKNKGKITIDNAEAGKDYNAWKIFDVTYSGTNYAYSIENNKSALLEIIIAYAGKEGNGLTLTKSADELTYVVEIKDNVFKAADFAKYLSENEEKLGTAINLNNSNGTAEISDLPLGYYFVKTNTGALCNLTTTNPTANIHDKNDVPFEKDIVETNPSVQVGQEVHFTLKGKVPDTTGLDNYLYKFTDTMSAGLKLVENSVKIKIGDLETTPTEITTQLESWTTKTDDEGNEIKELHYTSQGDKILYNDNLEGNRTGFMLYIDVNALNKTQSNIGKEILVTYSAIVTDAAVTVISDNTATLTYKNDYGINEDSVKTTPEDKVEIYSSKIVVNKTAEDKATPLAGAEFVLYRKALDGEEEGSYFYKYTPANAEAETPAKVEWVLASSWKDLPGIESNPSQYVKTTGTDGSTSFDGLQVLPDGKCYYLLETKAPTGYNLLADPVPVNENDLLKTLSWKSSDSKVDDKLLNQEPVTNSELSVSQYLTSSKGVVNSTGALLPSTGGIGTTIFYAAGIILMAGAVFFVVRRKRA